MRVWDVVRDTTFRALLDTDKLAKAGIDADAVIAALKTDRYDVVRKPDLELEIRSPVQKRGLKQLEETEIPRSAAPPGWS